MKTWIFLLMAGSILLTACGGGGSGGTSDGDWDQMEWDNSNWN